MERGCLVVVCEVYPECTMLWIVIWHLRSERRRSGPKSDRTIEHDAYCEVSKIISLE